MNGMEEGFESDSRNITQENEGGHGPRLEPAYACNISKLQQSIFFGIVYCTFKTF